MKPLTHYSKNGYQFALHSKKGNYAIFIGTKDKSKSAIYEVCHLRVTPAGARIVLDEKTNTESAIAWEAHERAPGDNEWGTHGWTYLTFKSAEAKLESLTQTL